EVPADKEPWKYLVTVRQMETNPNLGMIRAPAGSSISPNFSPAVHQYQLQVPFASTDVRIEARAQSRFARSVTVDGKETPGAVGAAVVDFSQVPQKPVTIEILAEDGSTRDTYQVVIVRGAPDSNAFLSSLDIQGIPYAPRFSPAQMGYQAVAPFETQSLEVRARPQSPYATVALTAAEQIRGGMTAATPFAATGDAASPGGAQVDFSQAASLPLVVQVTAQDGSVQQYLVNIRRAPPDANNLLSDLTILTEGAAVNLLPVFAPNGLSYSAIVPFPARQIRVIAHPQSRVAVLQAAGGFSAARGSMGFPSRGDPVSPDGMAIDLPADANRFSITLLVTAQNGGALLYVVDLRRAPPPPSAVVQAQPVQPRPAQAPPVQPVQPRPAPAQPQPTPAQLPPANAPVATGSDHFAVSIDLSLGSREMTALSAASDVPGNAATITVRPYRSNQIIIQDTTPLQAGKHGNTMSFSLRYKSPGVKLGEGGLIEVEIAVPTKAGKFLVYKEALPADHEMSVNVPFLLYSSIPSIPWPAVGSPVQVTGYLSTAAEHPEEKEKLQGNTRNETQIAIRLTDAKTGAPYGSNTFWRKPGVARGQSIDFSAALAVPEGAAV
ncbi:MAG TPA: cadherin-like beta sandwich domain-containing protein, partial [Spirochaetia bacterium]|nr:cadherin-like beta sandwich domain-containing protein [Spirochaetia bacterium]